MERKKLLIADDSELNRAILANMLEQDFEVVEAADGQETLAVLQSCHGELAALLLDVVMPETDGFAVLEEMKRRGWLEEIPVIMISAESGSGYIDHAFELGASDYISRPFATGAVRRRIINAILLHAKKQQLMDTLTGRFLQGERNKDIVIAILDYMLELRCGEGGKHMSGVGHITRLLLRRLLKKTDRYALDPDDVDVISLAAGLHDVGKILIPEEILKKPARLTAEEYEVVKQHPVLGAQLVAEMPVYRSEKLVKYTIEICRWHHERWNGEGYPDGLRGDGCPIAAQVAALADVYDALTSRRSYKEAFSHEKAIDMIHNGECGSFNPLLLECLDEVSDIIKRDIASIDAGQDPVANHRTGDSLYRERDIAAARMTRQLEESLARKSFFTGLSREMWFEYQAQPSSLQLSRGAVEQTGLPAVIVDPLQSSDFLTLIGAETVAAIRCQLQEMTPDELYAEVPARLLLNGELRRCRLSLLIAWTATDPIRCCGLFGKVTDVDTRYTRMEELGKTTQTPMAPQEQVLLPMPSADGAIHITADQVGTLLLFCRGMFRMVRLVDPDICMQLTDGDGRSPETAEPCYALWGRKQRCDNCISQEVVRTRRTQNKIDAIGNDLYYVLAMCVEIDGVPYSLECVNPIHPENMRAAENDSLLNQLLVRNRQVFTDSLTHALNRRYYDDRLRTLSGTYALAMIDIDNLKQINDCYGHPAGDIALMRAVQTLRAQLRGGDVLVRYGGDEFLLLFHGLPQWELRQKLEALCAAVRELRFEEQPELRVSISVGSIYAEGTIAELVQKADTALYRAKAMKDCAVLYEEVPHDAE